MPRNAEQTAPERLGPQGSWRTRWAPEGQGSEYLRYIMAAPNPIFPPVQQFPRVYGGPPPGEAMEAYRSALRANLQARAELGDKHSEWMLDWLPPDPLESVREELATFLAHHQPTPLDGTLDDIYGDKLDNVLHAYKEAEQCPPKP